MGHKKIEIGNSSLLKKLNRSKILSMILERGTVSRSELIKDSGLNQSTISRIVDEFIKAGLVYEHSRDESVPMGRKPAMLSINKEGKIIGVIVIDPLITDIAACDITGSVLKHVKMQTEKGKPESFLKTCTSKLASMLEPFDSELMGVGVTVPGKVNAKDGIVFDDPYLQWSDINVAKIVKKEFKCRVSVANDAEAGVLAQPLLHSGGQGAVRFRIGAG